MKIKRAFRYEIDPNNQQATLLAQHAGTARFAWNWALARRKEETEVFGKILYPKPILGETIGIDLGIKTFAVLSHVETIHSPKPLQKNLKRLKRLSKVHARKQKGSKNRRKSAIKLSTLHFRIRSQRQDFLHKASTKLAKTKSTIVIEDLSVKKMILDKSLARNIADAGWSEFRRMLQYKTEWYGSKLIIAPRFYPLQKFTVCHCQLGRTIAQTLFPFNL